MQGDFSYWNYDKKKNINSVLHQQGRIILDRDLNEQACIISDWQDIAGGDIVGKNVAAIPSENPDALKVENIQVNGKEIQVKLHGGRAWVDGMHVSIEECSFSAEHIGLPFQKLPDPPYGQSGTRDAIILEICREVINAFQDPVYLIEPALGGPDTTERVHTTAILRLLRLKGDETCHDIAEIVADKFSDKGKLRVTLTKQSNSTGPCPTVNSGGYRGLEHYLYRIEIARVNDSSVAHFKWSRFNGGLVCRGTFVTNDKILVKIKDNLQPVITSGLTKFYLEVVEYNVNFKRYEVTYGAKCALNSSNDLEIEGKAFFGTPPGSGKYSFIRLWDDIREVSEFYSSSSTSTPVELCDGIILSFDTDKAASYQAGDYWTFPVRAATANEEVLVGEKNSQVSLPPDGIHYHRVPLAIVNWTSNNVAKITDCRVHFRPLIYRSACCSITVGDGKSSHGDYDSVSDALDSLPPEGGEIHLLPGTHYAYIELKGRQNIRFRGCGDNTIIKPVSDHTVDSIFVMEDCQKITIENLNLIIPAGSSILLRCKKDQTLSLIEIKNNKILAYGNAIATSGVTPCVSGLSIHHNIITMLNVTGAGVGISVMAEDCLIERNLIGPVQPTAESIELQLQNMLSTKRPDLSTKTFEALGGIQILGGSSRVVISENEIKGGAGNGITLGSITPLPSFTLLPILSYATLASNPSLSLSYPTFATAGKTEMTKAGQASEYIKAAAKAAAVSGEKAVESTDAVSDEDNMMSPFIQEIVIERNEISSMGLCGICGFDVYEEPVNIETKLSASTNSASVNLNGVFNTLVSHLNIRENFIHDCLQQPVTDSKIQKTSIRIGFGGIALGFCTDLTIRNNLITDNGSANLTHSCGIYIHLSNMTEIACNTITGNGYQEEFKARNLTLGVSGGIVVDAATAFQDLDIETYSKKATTAIKSMPPDIAAKYQQEMKEATSAMANKTGKNTPMAARDGLLQEIASQANPVQSNSVILRNALTVHENTVDQPLGNALVAKAYGPVTVTHNTFISRRSLQIAGATLLEDSCGAVFLTNFGNNFNYKELILIAQAYKHLDTAQIFYWLDPKKADFDNETIFQANKVTQGSEIDTTFSQIIFSSGDISYVDNLSHQCYVAPRSYDINTFLMGMNLRVVENRFKEFNSSKDGDLSTLSLMATSIFMNHTTLNQADHCIATHSIFSMKVDKDNLLLWPAFVSTIEGSTEINCAEDSVVQYMADWFHDTSILEQVLSDVAALIPKEEIENKTLTISLKSKILSMALFNTESLKKLQDVREKVQYIQNLGAIEAVKSEKYSGPYDPNTIGALAYVDLGNRLINKVKAQEAITEATFKQEKITSDQAHLQGRAVDDSNLPIEGAIVKLEDDRGNVVDSMVTDNTGVYSFVTKVDDASGKSYRISVYDKNNTVLSRTSLKVAAGNRIITDVGMKKATISGTQKYSTGITKR